jgi:hypothetical protein
LRTDAIQASLFASGMANMLWWPLAGGFDRRLEPVAPPDWEAGSPSGRTGRAGSDCRAWIFLLRMGRSSAEICSRPSKAAKSRSLETPSPAPPRTLGFGKVGAYTVAPERPESDRVAGPALACRRRRGARARPDPFHWSRSHGPLLMRRRADLINSSVARLGSGVGPACFDAGPE